MAMLNLVIASKNKGKIKEIEELLLDFPVRVLSLSGFENITEVEETGTTFRENAELKAKSYALQTNHWTLADDSGLEVFALDNAPGIYSARYSGENASDSDNNKKLLETLKKVKKNKRQGRFVCALAVSNEKGEIQYFTEGVCNGKINSKPKGNNGFGYDPLFIPDNFDQTFGELPNKIKKKISHRSEALKKLTRFFTENMSS